VKKVTYFLVEEQGPSWVQGQEMWNPKVKGAQRKRCNGWQPEKKTCRNGDGMGETPSSSRGNGCSHNHDRLKNYREFQDGHFGVWTQ
jgi:hypothetical protein